MIVLLKQIRNNPLLWLLFFVPVVFIAGKARPEAHTMLFLLSILGEAVKEYGTGQRAFLASPLFRPT